MSKIKKTLLIIGILFIVIQLIQPTRNNDNWKVLPSDITKVYVVPDSILDIFKNSCYDCHSNNTRYPWYSYIQPGGWWLAHHIKQGKLDLNFSEFGDYTKRKQQNKLRAIMSSVDSGSMPIPAYTILHSDAKLTKAQKTLINDWVNNLKDSLSKTN